MIFECPKCSGVMHAKQSIPRKCGIYIQYRCASCRHIENNRNTDLKPVNDRRTNARKLNASCHNCTFWDVESERCREGWPDPSTHGPRYANECLDYSPSRQ
jgi:DNA-directed RNA polymerase subunit M/transcription elongation factor TFIIS